MSGVSAYQSVNVDQAKEIGETTLRNVEGNVTDNLEFKQSWQVKTFNDGSKSTGVTNPKNLSRSSFFKDALQYQLSLNLPILM